MTQEQAIDLLMFLSAVESWSFADKHQMPDYLHERLADHIELLRGIALEEKE